MDGGRDEGRGCEDAGVRVEVGGCGMQGLGSRGKGGRDGEKEG